MFEPGTRNTGTAIAGKNVANPIAMLNASVDMLYHLGHKTYADAISSAIRKTIVEDKIHTPGSIFISHLNNFISLHRDTMKIYLNLLTVFYS